MNMARRNAIANRDLAAFGSAVVVNMAALAVAGAVVPGVRVSSFGALALFAVVLALASYMVEPILFFLTMPINIATFGAFSAIVSGAVIILADRFTPGIQIAGRFWGLPQAVAAAIIISLFRALLRGLLSRISPGEAKK